MPGKQWRVVSISTNRTWCLHTEFDNFNDITYSIILWEGCRRGGLYGHEVEEAGGEWNSRNESGRPFRRLPSTEIMSRWVRLSGLWRNWGNVTKRVGARRVMVCCSASKIIGSW